MRASIGGIMNMVFLVVFIVIISSFLLFNVSYSQAYRVKNKIITLYEQYEGCCGKECQAKIKEYENRLGYSKTNLTTETKTEKCYSDLGYCVDYSQSKVNGTKKRIYNIRTEVSVRFPFVDKILGIGVFKIHGETSSIEPTRKCSL